jgi:hypothetical protein
MSDPLIRLRNTVGHNAAKRACRLVVAALVCLAAGCAERDGGRADDYEIVKSVEAPDAPLALTVKVDKQEIGAADSFRCIIQIRRGQDLVAELPERAELEQAFTSLLLGEPRRLPERIEEGFVVEADEYELEPLVPGTHTIKPFVVTYTVDGEERTLETKPVELVVTSLGADDPDAELRDIAGPVALPRKRAGWWAWIVVGVGAVGVAVLVLVLVRRRRPAGALPEKRRPAHEEALDALRALRDKDYIGQGMVMEFYVELSAILRWYIERRFGVHAPEQTTQEFLGEISRDGFFDLRRRTLLKEFLEHCDLVKFAKYGPTSDEIDRVFMSARTYIDETKEAGATSGV